MSFQGVSDNNLINIRGRTLWIVEFDGILSTIQTYCDARCRKRAETPSRRSTEDYCSSTIDTDIFVLVASSSVRIVKSKSVNTRTDLVHIIELQSTTFTIWLITKIANSISPGTARAANYLCTISYRILR